MASQAIWSHVLVFLVAVSASYTLTFDEDATNDAIAAASAQEDKEIAILVSVLNGKASGREELLHAKNTIDNTLSLFYNSKSNKVSLENVNNGHLKAVTWSLDSHPRENLILVVTNTRVKLYAGCKPLHWHSMSGRHDTLALLASQKLKLYHEENSAVQIFGSEKAALDSNKCNQNGFKPPTLVTVDSDVEEVKDFIRKEEMMKHEEEMQGDDYRTNYIDPNILPLPLPPSTQRGDIPAVDIESCDDEVVRQLKLMRQTIELLRRELADQKGTIDGLRNQLRACCNRLTTPPVERCTDSSCYPGY